MVVRSDSRELTIRDVDVVDGTGAEPIRADVVIAADRIVAVEPGGTSTGRGRVVDGDGLTLAPGFVDVHSHDDTVLLHDPDHGCKTLQGVTSVVVGNCGISAAPASDHTPGFTVYDRMGDYFDALADAGPAVNVGALVGHGAVRAAVMGLRDDRAPTSAELADMAHHVAAAMDDGALGMSSGLGYEPGRYAEPAELEALARLVADAGGIYTTHMRSESDDLLESVAESIAVAEATGAPLQISHLKAAGRPNWGRVIDALAAIDEARDRGVDVMADQYPYTRGSTVLEQVVSAGVFEGAPAFGHLSPEHVLIAAAPRNPRWEGRTIAEIAEAEGADARDTAYRIVEAEGRACIVVLDTMSEDDVCTVMAHPAVMVGSDGVAGGSKPHPRLHHTYPRVLGRYVREQGLLSLPDAVRRMTGLPARRFGFVDRGQVRVGAFADLVLLDAEAVADTGTYDDPTTVPAGIVGVWVNGVRVVDGGEVTGARPGSIVRGRTPTTS